MTRCIIFLSCLFFVACSPDKPQTSEAGMTQVTPPTGSTQKVVKASALAPLIGSWQAQATLGFKDPESRKDYEQIWFDLNGDQTFAHGQYEKQTHTGTYTFDETSNIIEFVFEPRGQKIANQYRLQGIGFQGTSTLIWAGNTPKNPDGMQLKMIKFNRTPAQ